MNVTSQVIPSAEPATLSRGLLKNFISLGNVSITAILQNLMQGYTSKSQNSMHRCRSTSPPNNIRSKDSAIRFTSYGKIVPLGDINGLDHL